MGNSNKNKKKVKPIVQWTCDIQFYGAEMMIKARTEGEARKKMIEKLKVIPAIKWLNKKNTYIDKIY